MRRSTTSSGMLLEIAQQLALESQGQRRVFVAYPRREIVSGLQASERFGAGLVFLAQVSENVVPLEQGYGLRLRVRKLANHDSQGIDAWGANRLFPAPVLERGPEAQRTG